MADDIELKTELLAGSRYFRELDPTLLRRIAGISRLRSFSPGDVLVRQGESADAMFVLASGLVEVYQEDARTGATRRIRTLAGGACFGEISFLVRRPRTASIRGKEAGRLLSVPAGDFDALVQKLPEVTIAMCRTLAEWIYSARSAKAYRFVKLQHFPIQTALVKQFGGKKIKYYRALPLSREGDRVVVAMLDPTDLHKIDGLRGEFPGCEIEAVVCSETDLTTFLKAAASGR